MIIPQLQGTEAYKYLGTEMPPGWARGKAQEQARGKVVKKCKQLLRMVGSLPMLTDEQVGKAMSLAVAGVIGYYGRSTLVTWADCQSIEAERSAVLRAKGRAPGTPRLQLYATTEEGGMGNHEHAYVYAAAAILDQFDRNLCAPADAPGRVAVESAIAQTCTQLGCRRGHPLEWHPEDLLGELDSSLLVEAWLEAKIRLGIRGPQAAPPRRLASRRRRRGLLAERRLRSRHVGRRHHHRRGRRRLRHH